MYFYDFISMAHSHHLRHGISKINRFLVVGLALLMLTPLSSVAGDLSVDPVITKVGTDYEATWDFSDMANYTLVNTTIKSDQLSLLSKEQYSIDDTTTDFLAGTADKINVTAPGSISLNLIGGTVPINGNFTSQPFYVGDVISFGTINWTVTVPAQTAIVVKTRTSPEAVTWTTWSSSYIPGDAITSPIDKYLQYWIQFTSTNKSKTPEVSSVTLSYFKYDKSGMGVTMTLTFERMALDTKFTSFGTNNGGTISYSYSKDGGATWKPIPGNGNLSAESFSKITLRTELQTTEASKTPTVQFMRIHYKLNGIPSVSLWKPANGAFAGTTQELKWNATDPDKHTLTFDLYMGTTPPYALVASNLGASTYLVSNLVPGRTYFWYISVKDPYSGTNKSATWSFIANSPPEVNLFSPPNGGKLTTNKVRFQWIGSDNEGQKLTFDLYLKKDGQLTKGVNGTNRSEVQLTLENKKTYQWYVVVNDGLLTNQSSIWTVIIDAPVNNLPQITNTPPATGVVGKPYSYQLAISDKDGDKVLTTFIPGVPVPPGLTLTTTSQVLWTPSTSGVFIVGLQLDDGKDIVKFYFNITVSTPPPNQPPKFLPIPDQVLKKDPVTLDLSGYMTDDGGPSQITITISSGGPNIFSASSSGKSVTITPLNNAKGKGNLTVQAMDGQGATAFYTFNVTVNNKDKAEPSLFQTLCGLWPIFLIVLIIVIVAIAVTVASKRSERRAFAVKRPPAQTQEKFETWDQMQGELYDEKKKAPDEDEPAFRGVRGGHGDEVMEMDDHYANSPTYVPLRTTPSEEEAPPPRQQPVFSAPIMKRPEEQVAPGPLIWKPSGATEEPRVFKDEKVEKAQQDEEIDDILSKLKSDEPEEPKKKVVSKKDPTLDDLLSKLKKK
jgi:hypothetical protein